MGHDDIEIGAAGGAEDVRRYIHGPAIRARACIHGRLSEGGYIESARHVIRIHETDPGKCGDGLGKGHSAVGRLDDADSINAGIVPSHVHLAGRSDRDE